METSDLHDQELKILMTKMLTEVRKRNENFNKQKILKIPNRNHRTEEYSN